MYLASNIHENRLASHGLHRDCFQIVKTVTPRRNKVCVFWRVAALSLEIDQLITKFVLNGGLVSELIQEFLHNTKHILRLICYAQ